MGRKNWENDYDGDVAPDGQRRLVFRNIGELGNMGGPSLGDLLVLEEGDTRAIYLDHRAEGDTAFWSDDGRFVVFFTFISPGEKDADNNRVVVADLETMEVRQSRAAYAGLELDGLDGTIVTGRFNTLEGKGALRLDIRDIAWYRRRPLHRIAWSVSWEERVGPAQSEFDLLYALADVVRDWRNPVWEIHPADKAASDTGSAPRHEPGSSVFDVSGVPRLVAFIMAPLLFIVVGFPLVLVIGLQALLEFVVMWGWRGLRMLTGRRMNAGEIGPAWQKVQAFSRSLTAPLLWLIRLPLWLLTRVFPPKVPE